MRNSIIIIILTLASIVSLLPFFKNGYFETDDGTWAVVRLASMHNELRQGQLPVRWSGSLNYGYGYPLFNFSYPGPYYIAEIFNVFGLSYVWSIKSVFILATIISVIGMYICAKELWKNEWAGIISATLYLIWPYRWVNLYIRGSIGEIVSFALFPFLFYVGIKLLATGRRRYLVTGAALLALLIISHNVMALLFLPFFFAAMISEILLRYVKLSTLVNEYIEKLQNSKKGFKENINRDIFFKHIHWIFIMIALGISLSAFFWLPAVSELRYTKLAQSPLTDIHAELSKIRNVLSTPFDNRVNEDAVLRSFFTFWGNMHHLLVVSAVVICWIVYKKSDSAIEKRVFTYAAMYAIMLFLLTQYSELIWKSIPGLKMVDFPWRLYGIIMFVQPLIIGVFGIKRKLRYVACVAVSIIAIASFRVPLTLTYTQNPDAYYATNQGTTTSADEYVTVWAKQKYQNHAETLITELGSEKSSITVTEKRDRSITKTLTYTADSDKRVQINLMYFPGWTVRVDGKKHPIDYRDTNGTIHTTLPQGTHTLDVRLTNTAVRNIANIISSATLCALVGVFCYEYIRKKRILL